MTLHRDRQARFLTLRAPVWMRLRPALVVERWPAILGAVLTFLLIFQFTRLLWTMLVPLSPVGAWQPATAIIATPAERRALFASFDPFYRVVAQGPAQATVTSLSLTLFGVNINEATGGGSAIIAGEDGVQTSYVVGDEIVPGVKLAGVAFDHVLIDRGGSQETLFLDQSGEAPTAGTGAAPGLPPPTPEPGSKQGTPPTSGELSPAAVRSGIGFAPRSENGKVTGLVVAPQGDGAAFRAAGLKPGDVIRSVNGRPVASAADAAAFANQLTPGARLSVEVERGANTVPVAILLSRQ